MTYDQLEAVVRAVNARPVEDTPLTLGERVAWMSRDHGKASAVSAVHRYYENGHTFCRLAVPPRAQHLPLLSSLHVCRRCEVMSQRALHHAQLAGLRSEIHDLKVLKVGA